MRIKGTDKAESWEKIYQTGDAGWDIGKVAPPFENIVKSHADVLPTGKLICFGAGKGHDAEFFASIGYDVTAVDFAPTAVAAISEYAKNHHNLMAYEGDILDLPFKSEFDYVLEHTCYCAIPPNSRSSYVDSAHKVLKKGGILFGLFYRFDPADDKGPPFSTSEEEIRSLFEEKFEIIEISTPANSHGRRKKRERLIIMKAK